MKEEEKLICDFMAQFIQDNWDKINLKKVGIIASKEEFINIVKTDIQEAMWTLSEVARWGMDKRDYLIELYCDNGDYDFSVIKLNNKYIKIKWVHPLYHVSFTEPKTKTITYFE